MIRTITTKARALLQDSSLSAEFWAEAIQTATYLHARSPTKANEGKTPYECLYSTQPNLLHLRRFGCLVYKLIPKPQRGEKKFGSRSQECVMLGYVHETAKIWRLWNPETKKVIQASDVYFDENKIVSVKASDNSGTDVLKAVLPEEGESIWYDDEDTESDSGKKKTGCPESENGPRDPGHESLIPKGKEEITQSSGRPGPASGESTPGEHTSGEGRCQERQPGELDVQEEEVAGTSKCRQQRLSHNTTVSRSSVPGSEEGRSGTVGSYGNLKRNAEGPSCVDATALRRSKRISQAPSINVSAREYEEVTSGGVPDSEEIATISEDSLCYEDALQYRHWRDAMQEEFDSLRQHKTWEPQSAKIDHDKKVIGCKWVYKTKIDADGKKRYKARLVIKGYEQVYGIDYDETFAPVARLSTLRMLLALSVEMNWYIHQMDVVAAFLYPVIDEGVYMEPPSGIEWLDKDYRGEIYELRKALYGLKQAPRLWFEEIDTYLREMGYTRSQADTNLYTSRTSIIVLYVDDILIASVSTTEIVKTKHLLNQKYQMKDLGQVRQFLGLEIGFGDGWVSLNQSRFIETVLQRFAMADCKGVTTPMESRARLTIGKATLPSPLSPAEQRRYQGIVGSLMYLAVASRPDMAFTFSVLSKFNATANTENMAAAKRALRYIRYTTDLGIQYTRTESSAHTGLFGYSDADWAGDIQDRKSTTGYLFLVSNGAVSWQARKQSIVALSTTEAEYVACSEACREAVALRRIYHDLRNIGRDYTDNLPPSPFPPTIILVDNQGAISLVENPRFHRRTKHIELKYHYVREMYQSRLIDIDYVSTQVMTADLLTKPLPRELHWRHSKGMGMVGSMSELKRC